MNKPEPNEVIENESIDDLFKRKEECLNQIQLNWQFLYTGIQDICKTHNPNQNGKTGTKNN